jgi:hypothetical protein
MCLNDEKTKENEMSSLFSISLSVITRRVDYFRASESCTFHQMDKKVTGKSEEKKVLCKPPNHSQLSHCT